MAEGKNDIPAEELDAIFNGASDDKSATNIDKSIPVSNSNLHQVILLKKLMVIKINFFKLLLRKSLFLTEKSIAKIGYFLKYLECKIFRILLGHLSI